VGAGGSYCGKGIILARFFGSFFIDWKNGYTAIRFSDGSFLITLLALFLRTSHSMAKTMPGAIPKP